MKRVQKIMHEHLKENYDFLADGYQRSEDLKTNHLNLGDSAKAHFLATVNLPDIETALNTAKVVYKQKRAVLIDIGGTLHCFGKFGQPFFYVPTGHRVHIFSTVHGRSMLSCQYEDLLEVLGAKADGYDRGDTVMNYSDCVVGSSYEKLKSAVSA